MPPDDHVSSFQADPASHESQPLVEYASSTLKDAADTEQKENAAEVEEVKEEFCRQWAKRTRRIAVFVEPSPFSYVSLSVSLPVPSSHPPHHWLLSLDVLNCIHPSSATLIPLVSFLVTPFCLVPQMPSRRSCHPPLNLLPSPSSPCFPAGAAMFLAFRQDS